MRYLSLILLGFLVIGQANFWVVVAESPSNSFELYDFGMAESTRNFKLKDSRPSEKPTAFVTLINSSKRSFTLASSKVACKCTTAKVPKKTIEPGEIATLEFSFEVSPIVNRANESFVVDVFTEQNVATFHIAFQTNIVDYANFAVREIFGTYEESSSHAEFLVPISVSDPTRISEMKVFPSKDSPGMDCQIVKNGDRVVAKCKAEKLANREVSGSLELYHPWSKVPDSIPFRLADEPNVRLLPSKIVFTPLPDSDGIYVGTTLLKSRNVTTVVDLDAQCFDSNGKSIGHEVVSLGRGLFRITIKLNREEFEKQFHELGKYELEWKFGRKPTPVQIKSHIVFSS
jgi:Protein of unknown function (DUF1573)